MPSKISLTSGSILNGSPITFNITPSNLVGSNPSIHRIVVDVKCGMSGGDFETIRLSAPVNSEVAGNDVCIDVSSALRTFRDSYDYTPAATTYPIVKFSVSAYDEYMINGTLHRSPDAVTYPENGYLCTIFGSASDLERMMTNDGFGVVSRLSHKPATSPMLVAMGEQFAYTPSFSTPQRLDGSSDLVAPQSRVTTVPKEGAQTLGYQNVFALPASKAAERQVFFFINSFGVLESVSIPRVYSRKAGLKQDRFAMAVQESYGSFSRAVSRKRNNHETWLFISDPLDEKWLQWYIHEFLMAEHVWMFVGGRWLPCTIQSDDEFTFNDSTKNEYFRISFSALFDLVGSPLP